MYFARKAKVQVQVGRHRSTGFYVSLAETTVHFGQKGYFARLLRAMCSESWEARYIHCVGFLVWAVYRGALAVHGLSTSDGANL